MPDRISIDPKVCHGQACIKGTRISLHQIVSRLANRKLCLEYAAMPAAEQVTPIEKAVISK